MAKNIKAFCSRNQIEPHRFNGLITLLHCHNEHDKNIEWQKTKGREGAEELRDTLKDFPLGTIQYAGPGAEKCWKREHWNGAWNAKAAALVDIIKEAGHPIVDPEPFYLKGNFDGAHFKSDDETRVALSKFLCMITRWGQFFKLLVEGQKAFQEVLRAKKSIVSCGTKPRVTVGGTVANNLVDAPPPQRHASGCATYLA